LRREEGEAIVRIRDSGIGIDPEILPHVFDLFVQADPSSRRADAGLGIGLALVRSLVERHGGRVTVASAGPGQGSEFTVRLPTPAE
jgi:signal transduction histidine kinase